jgi:hypothetical protein
VALTRSERVPNDRANTNGNADPHPDLPPSRCAAALTGRSTSLGIFDVLAALGREECGSSVERPNRRQGVCASGGLA